MEKIKQKQISEKRLDYINQVLKRCERLKILNESENMENAKKEDVELIQDLRKLGILITPPSERVRFPFREFHQIGHSTIQSSELRHGDHWYLYPNIGERPLLVEVKWAEAWENPKGEVKQGEAFDGTMG